MISSEELNGIELVLRKLDLGRFEDVDNRFDDTSWQVYKANYCVAYGIGGVYYDDDLEDDLLELTEEELKIMVAYDNGYGNQSYDRWYDTKLSDKAAEVLLGEDDE